MTEATLKRRVGELLSAEKNRTRVIFAAVLAAVALAWGMTAPNYWIFTANSGLILAASTVGLLVATGWAKEVSLVQAGLTGTGVYVCAFAYRDGVGWGWPYLAAAALGITAVVFISVVLAIGAAKLSGIYIMILTLALQVTIEKVVFTQTKLVDSNPLHPVPRPALLGVNLHSDRAYYFFTLAVLGLLILFLSRLRASRFGRALILNGTDRQAASSVGVSPWRAKVFAFALAGLCAGVAGALTAPLYSTPPSAAAAYGSLNSLFYLAIPVLAGFRSLIGVVVVALTFVLIPQALERYHISVFVLGGVGLMLGTLAGARGISGFILDQVQALRRRRAGRVTVDVSDGTVPEDLEGPAVGRSSQRALDVLEAYLPEQAAAGEDVMVADKISVAFGGLRALSEVSLTVPARKMVGLIGPNGAGKSTLFDVINGLRRPDAGEISLFGREITDSDAWDRVEMGLSRTFQSSRVNLTLSVGDNLLAGAFKMIPGNVVEAVVGAPRARNGERRAEEAGRAVAELLGLHNHWDEFVGNLDFGAQRRVEIGRSLLSGPRLLLLDEPAAGLDAAEANSLFVLIRRLEEDLGLTVLLVEHYVKAVLEHCDQVYVLSEGKIIAAGTPDEIVTDPQVRAVYLGQAYEKGEVHVDA